MKLLIATKNRGKVLEMRALLGPGLTKTVEVLTLADIPNVPDLREEGRTFAENARAKAVHYADAHRLLCIAEDSGLAVDALGGRPGVRSARFAGESVSDAQNIAHLLKELQGHPRPWKAAFVCHAVAALPRRIIAEATGRVAGEIIPERRGTEGFGYDPVFFLPDKGKTMAELTTVEKNLISHRGQAIRQLIADMRAGGIFG